VAKTLARSFAIAVTAVGVSAAAAGAQAFNFSTTGYFTSAAATCNQPAPGMLTVVCADPTVGSTLTLSFTGRDYTTTEPGGFSNGSQVTLGNFTVAGNGSAMPTGSSVMFTLVINQSMPTVGTGSTAGFITGTISRPVGGSAFSDLIWRPTEVVNIGGTTYDLVFRDLAGQNGIILSASGNTTIEAIGTTSVVPEPSTVILLGSGIAGLGLFGLRNRRRNSAV